MLKRNLPQPFQIDKARFKDCFTARSLRHFAVLITGWVMTMGIHTISQVILTGRLHESEHFSSIYRFLQKSRWTPDQVACEVFSWMWCLLCHYCVVVGLQGISGRVFCLPYAARLWYPEKAKVKPVGEHQSKSDLGVQLIRLTLS